MDLLPQGTTTAIQSDDAKGMILVVQGEILQRDPFAECGLDVLPRGMQGRLGLHAVGVVS